MMFSQNSKGTLTDVNGKKVLHLTLKKKWFDMIKAGEKKEEYREIKPYWSKRLIWKNDMLRDFGYVLFKNGYSKDAPQMLFEVKGIRADFGKKKWGAEEGQKYFVIRLGKEIDYDLPF